MKKLLKILLVILIAGAAGGYIYWQLNKKKIVRNAVEKAITKKTDSLYYLHYDSSRIDEVAGNASFYNVVLQPDSVQRVMLNSMDSLPNVLYKVSIDRVTANGIDIAGLLQKQNVAAKKIEIFKPVIQIINTGADHPKPVTTQDTLELYEKMLGKFKSIQAGVIQVTNGTLIMTGKNGKDATTLNNINITLNNFVVDSTRNYENIISYFIKDVHATVEDIRLPATMNGSRVGLKKLDYDATKKSLEIGSVHQYGGVDTTKPVTELKNIRIAGLNTDAFIKQQELKAGKISCEGGVITIYVKKGTQKGGAKQSVEWSTNLIDQARVDSISLGRTTLIIADKDEPAKSPFILKNAALNVTKILNIHEGSSVTNLINNAEWELSADGFSFNTKDKLYKVSVGNFIVNNKALSVKISNFSLKPLLTEQQFVRQSSEQRDLFNVTINNIGLSGVNIKRLVADKELEVDNADLQLILKVFDDRTLPPYSKTKVGRYPYQSLLKLPFPVYLHTIKISNGLVSYREKAIKSKLTGNIIFSNINGTLLNVTNMKDRIKVNNLLKLTATAKFLGAGKVSTEWVIPLDAVNGEFNMKGRLSDMSALTLNPIIKPLAMASIKKGQIDSVAFTMAGTDLKAAGNVLFLYHDLKMDLLKKGDDQEFRKKGLVSLLANAIIKNENTDPSNTKNVQHDRDTSKSFFNLVWKTIYAGAKNTALGKK